MLYLTRMLGKPVVDSENDQIGIISDLAIATGEVFPRITSLAFRGPDNTPFMLSWRKFAEEYDGNRIRLNVPSAELRFSYLQPDEVLLGRDLLNKKIVDTQGMKVVRVRDLSLSESGRQLRLLGADVGPRAALRAVSPLLERFALWAARAIGRDIPEHTITWNYVDLIDRDLSQVRLSVSHRRLHELHPADAADIIEELSPNQRSKVFVYLDNRKAAKTLSEMEDRAQTSLLDRLPSQRASAILGHMEPDDAADILGGLPYEKAEALLRLMGVEESRVIRSLLGYRDDTAGGIMTPEVTTVTESMTGEEVIDRLRNAPESSAHQNDLYVLSPDGVLEGRITLHDVIIHDPLRPIADAVRPDVLTVSPEDHQNHVAEIMSKYDLHAIPVVDETGHVLGVITLDDVIEIVRREHGLTLEAAPAAGRASREELGMQLQLAYVDPLHALSVLESSLCGLDEETVRQRLETDGSNRISRGHKTGPIRQLVAAFANPFNAILFALGVVSYLTDVRLAAEADWTKIVILFLMIAVGGIVRFVQEFRGTKAAESLREMVQTTAAIIRKKPGSAWCPTNPSELLGPEALETARELPIETLVTGDILLLHSGDLVPADVRLLASNDLFVDESSLTGESLPVEKYARPVSRSIIGVAASALEAETLCFMGTSVVSGSAAAVVLATGPKTYLGSLGETIDSKPEPTSFDRGVSRVSWVLIAFMLVMAPLVFVLNWVTKGSPLNALFFALAIAVGLTPEMLPMIVSTNLARGAVRMSRHKVIVKQASAIQNLGAMDVLCTDKTGTLTENHIVLEKHIGIDGESSPEVLRTAFVNSRLQTGLRNLLDEAVLEFAARCDIDSQAEDLIKLDEIAFDFVRKRLSVIVRDTEGRERIISKGAAEEILDVCTRAHTVNGIVELNDDILAQAHQRIRELNEQGMRVVGVGYREISNSKRRYTAADERNLTLTGFLGFLDPPKPDAAEAIRALITHGVEVKVLTGDNEIVARRVCSEVGLPVDRTLLGSDLEVMDDTALAEAVRTTNVLAKLSPLQKSRVVKVLQNDGKTVGFLGDGINDSAALRTADVGISVDTAVDTAKESADVILLEKNLLVLERGIIEGRTVYGNIVKYVKTTASSNFGNVFSILPASAFLPFLPMLPLQLLVLNLIYDLSSLALPWDRVDEEFLAKPQTWDASGVAKFMFFLGPTSSVFDLVTFYLMFFLFGANVPARQALFQSGWFVQSMMTQSLVVHMLRTTKIPFIQSRSTPAVLVGTLAAIGIACILPFTPVGRSIGLTALPPAFWPCVIVIVFCYMAYVQIVKWAYRERFGGEWM